MSTFAEESISAFRLDQNDLAERVRGFDGTDLARRRSRLDDTARRDVRVKLGFLPEPAGSLQSTPRTR